MTEPADDTLVAELPDVSRLAGKNVLIVGINYAPDQIGIAPYTTQMAEYLAARGANVAVTTGIPYYPEYKVAPADRWTFRRDEDINGVRVQRVRHTVPRKMTAARRAVHEATFLGHALLRKPPFRPDVVIGVTPALSGAVGAARFAKRYGAPLVLIFQDLTGPGAAQSGISGGKAVSDVTARAEAWAIRQATEVTVLHAGFTAYARSAGVPEGHLHIVRNWSYAVPAAKTAAQARADLGWPSDRPVVLYAGNMGLKMGLSNVVDAARLADQRGEKILFVLLGDGSQRPELEQMSRGISTIRFEDSRFGSDFADALVAADVLMINERPGVSNMSLPSKLAYYFTSGRPVLAAAEAGGTTALEIERAEAGVVTESGSPEGLLNAALDLARDEVRSRAMGEAGRTYAASAYDRDAILGRYETIIADAISRR